MIISEHTYTIFCYCCLSADIEEIINRPFTKCGVCYCCVGDDPAFDSPDLCVFVDDKLNKNIVFWDEKSPCKYYNN